jgi:hypothetical protein
MFDVQFSRREAGAEYFQPRHKNGWRNRTETDHQSQKHFRRVISFHVFAPKDLLLAEGREPLKTSWALNLTIGQNKCRVLVIDADPFTSLALVLLQPTHGKVVC